MIAPRSGAAARRRPPRPTGAAAARPAIRRARGAAIASIFAARSPRPWRSRARRSRSNDARARSRRRPRRRRSPPRRGWLSSNESRRRSRPRPVDRSSSPSPASSAPASSPSPSSRVGLVLDELQRRVARQLLLDPLLQLGERHLQDLHRLDHPGRQLHLLAELHGLAGFETQATGIGHRISRSPRPGAWCPVPGSLTGSAAPRSRRPARPCSRTPASPRSGSPRASRLTVTPRPASSSCRYMAVPSPSSVGFSPRMTSSTATPPALRSAGRSIRASSAVDRQVLGLHPSSGLSRPIRHVVDARGTCRSARSRSGPGLLDHEDTRDRSRRSSEHTRHGSIAASVR
jgi:hypothetical protein